MLKQNAQSVPSAECRQVGETEVQAVKRVLTALIAAVRNFSLYPFEHSICQKSILHFKNSLSEFFTHEKAFRIEIKKDGLFYQEIKIYEGALKNDPLLAPLFRDGILWIEISPQVELSELEVFLKLYAEHRSLKDEAESDLVTALWKANLKHISYDAINAFWESPPVFSFSHFSLGHEGRAPIEEVLEEEAPTQAASDPGFRNIHFMDRAQFFELTTTEKQLLGKLIASNNERDNTLDVVRILIVILADQSAENDFSYILELLEQEAKLALENARFKHARAVFERIKQLAGEASGPFSWRNKLIHDFFHKLSSDAALKSLETGLLKLKSTDTDQISSAERLLQMLEPKAVETLAGLLLKIRSRTVYLLLMSSIRKLSLRDLIPLERLFKHPNASLVKQLISILAPIKGRRAGELLLRLMDHSSEGVRQKALQWLIKRRELPLEKIHAFLNDSDAQVRAQVVDYMRREKKSNYESILRSYIEGKKFGRDERAFLITCYQVLGECASKESLHFLERKLFRGAGFSLFGPMSSLHRQGAAVALAEVGSPEAKHLLNRASRSLNPSIRRASIKALQFTAGAK
jgi:HEAT repeat protein